MGGGIHISCNITINCFKRGLVNNIRNIITSFLFGWTFAKHQSIFRIIFPLWDFNDIIRQKNTFQDHYCCWPNTQKITDDGDNDAIWSQVSVLFVFALFPYTRFDDVYKLIGFHKIFCIVLLACKDIVNLTIAVVPWLGCISLNLDSQGPWLQTLTMT